MFMSTTFWFLVAFVLFFLFFGRLIWKALAEGLDSRSRQIEEDIEEAARTLEEAQAVFNEIKSKHLQAEKHADAIMEHAKVETERLRSETTKELDEFLKHREELVEQRIKYAEDEAVREIRNSAIRIATQASEKILAIETAKKKEIDALIIKGALEDLQLPSNER